MTRAPEPPDFPASQLFLRRLAFHLVRDSARAEDLVQETWAAWVERAPSGVQEPRAWLARVLRNRAFNQKREDARRARRERLAGSPDPSAPATAGTLEAQAELLAALRRLEEPFRTTLVERYYHDLSPRAIAERSGAPLNTVKARLARGLEKLRAEMDRRYHGDRGAWCHWLTVLGAPGPQAGEAQTSAPPIAGVGSGVSLAGWAGVGLLVVLGALWRSGWLPPGRGEAGGDPPGPAERIVSTRTREEPPATHPRGEGATDSVQAHAGQSSSPVAESALESALSSPARSQAPAHWPQFEADAAHTGQAEGAFALRRPRIAWWLPGLAGQPTVRNGELYSGGAVLARVDLRNGTLRAVASAVLGEAQEPIAEDESRLETLLREPHEPAHHEFGSAPVLTPRFAIARRLLDGSVTAFELDLARESWHFEPEEGVSEPAWAHVPPCLTEGGVLVVVAGARVHALDATRGVERWRFEADGEILMTPAAARGAVYFGTERGSFYALEEADGFVRWRLDAGRYGAATPRVFGERVLALDQGPLPWSPVPYGAPSLRAFEVRGWELWRSELTDSRPLQPGFARVGAKVLLAYGSVMLLDLASGRRATSERMLGAFGFGTPRVVGTSWLLNDRERLRHVDSVDPSRSWAFEVPGGGEVTDLVPLGARLLVATTRGLFCLEDEPGDEARWGFRLEWSGRSPGFLGLGSNREGVLRELRRLVR